VLRNRISPSQAGATSTVAQRRTRFGAWGTPVRTSFSAVHDEGTSIGFAGRPVRVADQFSFDIGDPTTGTITICPPPGQPGRCRPWHQVDSSRQIRIAYTTYGSDGRYVIAGSQCALNLTSCRDVPEWSTRSESRPGQKGDQFSPLVRAARGLSASQPVFMLSYYTRQDDPLGTTVGLAEMALHTDGRPWGSPLPLDPWEFTSGLPVCPDARQGGGYWGDYDDMQLVSISSDNTTPTFMRTFTDSSSGACSQWTYQATPQHVSSFLFR
jgi:hypothetical protein